MRVIAGRLGGRRLSAPRGRTTRPTSDRVREALFSMLGPIDGVSVLDLFAGTGALGIEALSRGAAKALFVERDAAAVAVLKGNLAQLELAEPQARVRVGEALVALRSARRAGETYDLVFVDPPYGQLRDSERELSALLPTVLAPGARVVVESDRRAPAELSLGVTQCKCYGDTTITIHRTEDNDER
ncbi:MAG: 16S rRNA (guanine(966)-N(2))-methyltransferase RsmD [Solirubrobacteraceae bacterium]